jgi:hypothetical protein
MNTDLMQGIFTRTVDAGDKISDLVNLLIRGAKWALGRFHVNWEPLKKVQEFDEGAHVLDINVPEGKYQGKVRLKWGGIPLATWTQGIHIR